MQARRSNTVTRVAAWHHQGVTYQVLVGQVARLAGYLTILAFGPDAAYRAVVVRPPGAHRALSKLLATADPRSRSGTAECLLALQGLSTT
jgi:hypothetical protein